MPRVVMAKWFRKPFPTTEIQKFIPQMPYAIPDKPIKVRGGRNLEHLRREFSGQMRLKAIAKSVTKLIDEERIELAYFRAYEVRNYTERLICEAIRYGDCHRPTMELADFYLNDKTLVHKLFKVLVPRYMNHTTAFTSMHLLPAMPIDWKDFMQRHYVEQKVVLELKNNPYPKIRKDNFENKNLLHNILLSQVAKEFYKDKVQQEQQQQEANKNQDNNNNSVDQQS